MSKNINISARTIGALLEKSPWNNRWDTFMKIVKPPSNACNHGIKYENDAIEMYKLVSGNKNVKIDKSIHRHKKYDYITGQVDGIVTLNDGKNAILEVKCPYNESFDPTDFKISSLYWIQVQIYMELFDIDLSHYCEYYRFDDNNTFFRWKEIKRNKEWFNKLILSLNEIVDHITIPDINTYNPSRKRKRQDKTTIEDDKTPKYFNEYKKFKK